MVCEGCRRRVAEDLADIPDLTAHLADVAQPLTSVGERVAGTAEPRLPINVDAIDLAGPARPASRALLARGVLGLDNCQTGELSVATTLDTWVRDWAATRGEHLPAPTVPWLAHWLANRLEWACGEHLAVDEFATEMRDTVRTLRRVTGVDKDDTQLIGYCPGAHGDTCGAALRVTPWQDVAECPRCSARWPRAKWLWLRATLKRAA